MTDDAQTQETDDEPIVSPDPPWAAWAHVAVADTPLALAVAAGSACGEGDLVYDQGMLYARDVSQAALDAANAAHDPAAAAAAESRAALLAALKAEAGRVIGAVVPTTAQLNLNAAMNVIGAKATSARTAAERTFSETFAEGHAWIQAVRARLPELLAAGGETPAGEARWPEPSQAVRNLASGY